MANPPVRGTLKTNSTVTGNEADDKYRLAMHILNTMDTVNNSVNDSENFGWVDAPANYKNYVADWDGKNNITGLDLSQLCSGTAISNMEKPWLPTITSNRTTISDTEDTKITLTFSNYGDNTDVQGGEAPDFDILDSNGVSVTGAVKGFGYSDDNKKVILTLENDVNWSTQGPYKVKHTMNKGGSDPPALEFVNNDPIYDFEASSFILTDTLAPTVTISKAFNGTDNADAKINTVVDLEIVFTFNRDGSNFTKGDITVTPQIANFGTFNTDKDEATLTDIPVLTDGQKYTFSVAAGAFQSVSGVNNTASNDLEFTFDTTPPTIVSGEVTNTNGLTLVLTMSENVEVTTGTVAAADFTIGGTAATDISASGNTLTLTLGTAITTGERPTIAYDATNQSVKDKAGNAMATRAAVAIDVGDWTNNSTQTVVYEFTLGSSNDNIFKYDGSNGKLTLEKWDDTVAGTTDDYRFDITSNVTHAVNNNIGVIAQAFDGINNPDDIATSSQGINDLGLSYMDDATNITFNKFGLAGKPLLKIGATALGNSKPWRGQQSSDGDPIATTASRDIIKINKNAAGTDTFWKPSEAAFEAIKDDIKIIMGDNIEVTKTSTNYKFIFTNISE